MPTLLQLKKHLKALEQQLVVLEEQQSWSEPTDDLRQQLAGDIRHLEQMIRLFSAAEQL